MKQFEKLLMKIPNVQIIHDECMPKGLSGFYEPNTIRLNNRNNYHKNVEVLAEEIGHYYTSNGDITDYSNINNMKQELRARRYAVKLLMPLEKLIKCYEDNIWGDKYEMCDHLEITSQFFDKAIEDYKNQFGSYVKYEKYILYFDPLNIKRSV